MLTQLSLPEFLFGCLINSRSLFFFTILLISQVVLSTATVTAEMWPEGIKNFCLSTGPVRMGRTFSKPNFVYFIS